MPWGASFVLNSDLLPSSDNHAQSAGVGSSDLMDKSAGMPRPSPEPSVQTQPTLQARHRLGYRSTQPFIKPPAFADGQTKENEVHDTSGTPCVSPPPTRTVDQSQPILQSIHRPARPRHLPGVLEPRKATSARDDPPSKKSITHAVSIGGSSRERLRMQLIGLARAGTRFPLGLSDIIQRHLPISFLVCMSDCCF
ncbi:hypothetical protein BD410DRAFT_793150 [Rickenella mellea]|uniref:Uncharacterized protein n=1 Tax=Rickenella mellea TaxID=50990 RepID=A0A4Y7PU89_9AGAM|nr:hypothetical protein BD410DRAFT_793150 [Rickenella mellea]